MLYIYHLLLYLDQYINVK